MCKDLGYVFGQLFFLLDFDSDESVSIHGLCFLEKAFTCWGLC